jgi:hypothetical protein
MGRQFDGGEAILSSAAKPIAQQVNALPVAPRDRY